MKHLFVMLIYCNVLGPLKIRREEEMSERGSDHTTVCLTRPVRYIPHFAALVVPIESTEFDSDRSPSLPKVGSLFMAGGESAIAGNYTCRAAEQRSLHTLGGVTTDYSAEWSPPPALLCSSASVQTSSSTQCSVLIITSTPELNQKECGPKSLQRRVCTGCTVPIWAMFAEGSLL